MENNKSGYFMFNPKMLQESIKQHIGPGTKHIMVFQNNGGSIVAKSSSPEHENDQKTLNSYAEVLANLCNEYIEFGMEAFVKNKLK